MRNFFRFLSVLAFLVFASPSFAVNLCDNAWMSTATTGTGTITLGSALPGYQTFASCGITNGQVVRYRIFDSSSWEIGSGTYTSAGTTLSRTVSSSSNANTAINLSGSATVIITAVTADLPSESTPNDTTVSTSSQIFSLEGGLLSRYPFTNFEAALNLANLAGQIITTQIANAAVTYAKIQNVAANSVLANNTASSASVSEVGLSASQLLGRGSTGNVAPISLSGGLVMSGTTLSAGDVNGPGSSTDTGIARFSGTGGKTIQNSGVTIGSDNEVIFTAGGTTTAPYKLQSGTNLTTAEAGATEFDGKVQYFTPVASARSIVPAVQYISLTSTYTLTSQTAAQKLFNSSTNGALNAEASTTYDFECMFSLSSMSASVGTFGFAMGGTATLTSIQWTSQAIKATTLSTQAAWNMTFNTTSANTALTATSTSVTTGAANIKGVVRVNAAGTLIPQVSLGVAAAAVVGVNSYCKLTALGSNTMTTVGNFQ